jgi:thiosulfate/3-mercaptopyruvate sulfurtransferase
MTFLIETGELAGMLGNDDLAVVDASWYLPAQQRDARAEYLAGHVPGAVYLDIEVVSDRTSPLPHMLPTPEAFAAAAGAMGIAETMTIAVYDGAGLFSAPRGWWMFRAMGAGDVRVLNGGLPKWRAEGRALASGAEAPRAARFRPRFDPALVADLDRMRSIVAAGAPPIVDSRPPGRFAGSAPEPRAGLRAGHMPGAANLPQSALTEADGRLKAPAALAALFAGVGVDPAGPVVASCGSGVSAASIALALAVLGNPRAAVYDGSWSEWGGRQDTPVATGD